MVHQSAVIQQLREIDPLAQVIADARNEAAVLRLNGHPAQAESLDRFVERTAEAAESYLAFLVEDDARLRSGKSKAWLRSRFAEWERQGHAFKRNGARYYRELVLPQRAHTAAARAEGRRVAGRDQ